MSKVRNVSLDPACTRERDTWRTSAASDGSGHYTYTLTGSTYGAFSPFNERSGQQMDGMVAFVALSSITGCAVENASRIASGDDWFAWRFHDPITGNTNLTMAAGTPPVTLYKVGIYTFDDWQNMQASGVQWFDGDSTLALETAGGGLSFLDPDVIHLRIEVAA